MDIRQRTTWGIRFRFLIRVIGLLGAFAAAAGAVLCASVYPDLEQWKQGDLQNLALRHRDGEFAYTSSLLLHIGLGAVALWLLVEVLAGLFRTATRRTAAGTSATLAAAAAVALLLFVNAYSLQHYHRCDLTRDQKFTLPKAVADELRQLRPDEPTTIIVLQKHRTFGSTAEIRDSYVSESEAKVAEKVQDLVDQFREFGPRFNVVVLDTERFGYESQLAELTKAAPELKAAIATAPENSILFHANGHVQRLGFNEFLQLDKTASKQANGGRGNLVLVPQGVENFARRILAAQERRPKIAVCTIHGELGTEGSDSWSYAGFKKKLTEYGFDVVDIVLKKWGGGGPPVSVAYTRQESKIEEIEAELRLADLRVGVIRGEVASFGRIQKTLTDIATQPIGSRFRFYRALLDAAETRSWAEILSVYTKWKTVDEKVELAFRKDLAAKVEAQQKLSEQHVAEAEKERRAVDARLVAVLKDERSLQDRRETNVKAKFARLLSDVDLLVIPRYTFTNVASGGEIRAAAHALDKDQIDVIRDYMKSGRPVLALLGSISETQGPSLAAMDGFETLLAERGIELGRETIVYDSEMKALSMQGVASLFGSGGSSGDIEPLTFTDRTQGLKVKPNPVGEAMRRSGRSLEQNFNLKLRALRPVYVNPAWQEKLKFAAEFIVSGPDSWNEVKPFAQEDSIPKYEPAKENDPKKGTRFEERRGPFPVAALIEGPAPVEWYDTDRAESFAGASSIAGTASVCLDAGFDVGDEDRQKAIAALLVPFDGGLAAACLTAESTRLHRKTNSRLAVIGSGAVFVGPELKPAQEQLLLHCVNWLVSRSDRLPAAPEKAWAYPRVNLDERDLILWRWGTGLLLPLAVVILGVLMTMARRVR